MFNNYYDIMKLPHDEAELLVGEVGNFNVANKYLVVSLDEWFTGVFSTKYSVIKICDIHYGRNVDKREIGILLPGIDDFNFRCWFYSSPDINLSSLETLMFEWAKRYNYRNINAHALADYCRYIGCYDVDWN